MAKIYTKTGDKGETSLWGGSRIAKNSLRVEAYGDVDELNSFIGLAISKMADKKGASLLTPLKRIQNELMVLGSDLATPLDSSKDLKQVRISPEQVRTLENEIDKFDLQLTPLQHFVLPGGSESASLLHVARTVCRRSERVVVSLAAVEDVNPEALRYLNRLSDWLFVAARFENFSQEVEDEFWLS